ncbi:MAG: protein kinase [Myxococcota bacterium]
MNTSDIVADPSPRIPAPRIPAPASGALAGRADPGTYHTALDDSGIYASPAYDPAMLSLATFSSNDPWGQYQGPLDQASRTHAIPGPDLWLLGLAAMAERGPTISSSNQPPNDTPDPTQPQWDFEHERAKSAARRALFGADMSPLLRIGRYRIERRIGAGGMGEVYQGIDTELDRKVAVKLVLPDLSSSRGSQRLRREARALARLSHPNVVQVYEVGEFAGRTFLAMEYVEGGTLARWLQAEPRRWTAVVERFVAAGRGLAAAHAAGVIHRDFKPDNVLMTQDGRARVADFGLAFTDELPTTAPTKPQGAEPGSESSTNQRLSMLGTVLGTIRYMPLEQLRGEDVDARADQFAFCVALYEALWRTPPLPITNMFERLEALEQHEVTPPPRAGVPRGLWRAIRRGLARDPAERWPDMQSLLAALQAVPRRHRRLAIVGLTTPLAGLLVVLGRASRDDAEPPAEPCTQIRQALDTSWNEARSQALTEAFEATSLPFASTSAAAIRTAVDDWGEHWLDEREQLCLATAHASLPGDVLGLRSTCLDHQREHFEASVEVLLDADAHTVTEAHDQVAHLPNPADCGDDEQLLLGVRPPDAAQAAEAARLRRALARGQAERLAGHTIVARDLVMPALATAEDLGYRPLLAEALTEAGELAIDMGDPDKGIQQFQRAVDLAEASRHDRLAARIWLNLTTHPPDADDTSRRADRLRRATAASERVGIDRLVRSRLKYLRGQLAERSGNLAQAESDVRAALDEIDELDSRGADLLRPSYLGYLAKLVAESGRPKEALDLRRESLQAAEAGYGPHHPKIANHAFALGQVLQANHQYEEAAVMLERAASAWLSSPGTPDADLGTALLSLSQRAITAEDFDKADRYAKDARAIFTRSLPEDDPKQGDANMLMAVIAERRGDPKAALQAFERAATQYERSLGKQAPILMNVRLNAAITLLKLERIDEARAHFEALLIGPADPIVWSARVGLATIELHDGNPDAAHDQLGTLAGARDQFDAGTRLDVEFLDKLTRLRLTRLRRTRPVGRYSEELLAALCEPTHEFHEFYAWMATITEMTDDEGRHLGLATIPRP